MSIPPAAVTVGTATRPAVSAHTTHPRNAREAIWGLDTHLPSMATVARGLQSRSPPASRKASRHASRTEPHRAAHGDHAATDQRRDPESDSRKAGRPAKRPKTGAAFRTG